MALKYLEKMFNTILLVTSKIQMKIKTTMTYHFLPTKLAIKNTHTHTQNGVGEEMAQSVKGLPHSMKT